MTRSERQICHLWMRRLVNSRGRDLCFYSNWLKWGSESLLHSLDLFCGNKNYVGRRNEDGNVDERLPRLPFTLRGDTVWFWGGGVASAVRAVQVFIFRVGLAKVHQRGILLEARAPWRREREMQRHQSQAQKYENDKPTRININNNHEELIITTQSVMIQYWWTRVGERSKNHHVQTLLFIVVLRCEKYWIISLIKLIASKHKLTKDPQKICN